MRKRFMAVILTVAMAAACFTGCSDSASSGRGSSKSHHNDQEVHENISEDNNFLDWLDGNYGEPVNTGRCVGDYGSATWTLYDSGVVVFEGKGRLNGHKLNMPNDDYPLFNNDDIKGAVFGEGITAVTSVLNNDKNCSYVKLPSTLKEIASFALNDMPSLTKIEIPEGVDKIGERAFAGSGLKSITLPSSMKTVPKESLSLCTSLEEVIISDDTEKIDELAFFGCDNLRDVTIPDSVTEICTGAFQGCDSLKKIVIPDSVTHIDEYAFSVCTSLEDVTLSNGLTYIHEGTFSECDSLKELYIPDSIDCITPGAIPETTVIKGSEDSYAKKYAKENGNKFIAV